MRKDLISLNELQLYIKSLGNSNNERVKTFLKEVFKIGFTNQLSDIFPMDEFLYGDFLILDKEFIYKEYLNFLKDNEGVDDTLYYIAENNYEKFNSLCLMWGSTDINEIYTIFKTKKQIDEEPKIKFEESFSMRLEEREPDIELFDLSHLDLLYDNHSDKKKDFHYQFNRRATENEELKEVNRIEELQNKIPDIHSDVFSRMKLNTNDHLKYNVYARIRIEDYNNDIKKVKDTLSNVFQGH